MFGMSFCFKNTYWNIHSFLVCVGGIFYIKPDYTNKRGILGLYLTLDLDLFGYIYVKER